MKHVGGILLAVLSFGIATVLLLNNVKDLEHAPLLLGAIVLFYLLAFIAALPTQMAEVRLELTAWWTAYRGGGGPV